MNEPNLPLPLGGGINGVILLARIYIYTFSLQGDFNRRKTGSVPTKYYITRIISNLSKWCKNIKCLKFYILSFPFSKLLHINNYLRQKILFKYRHWYYTGMYTVRISPGSLFPKHILCMHKFY
jgi:hypothetical protein